MAPSIGKERFHRLSSIKAFMRNAVFVFSFDILLRCKERK